MARLIMLLTSRHAEVALLDPYITVWTLSCPLMTLLGTCGQNSSDELFWSFFES